MFLRNIKERLRLLEYENEILIKEINNLKGVDNPSELFRKPRMITEGGNDFSYDKLRKKHRKYDLIFKDGFKQ